MAHLSSCYFCGVAVDEPLQMYRVPDSEGSESATVTLCPTCQHKLDTVLEASGQAELAPVTEPSAVEMTARSADESRDTQPEQSDDEDVETIGEGVIDEDEMVEESDDEDEMVEESDDEPADGEAGDDDLSENPLAENDKLLDGTNDLDTDGISDETLDETDLGDEMEAAGFGETPSTADGESDDSSDDTGAVEGSAMTADSEDDDTGITSETEPDVPDEFETSNVGERGGASDDEDDDTADTEAAANQSTGGEQADDGAAANQSPGEEQADNEVTATSGQSGQSSKESAETESGGDEQPTKSGASISALEYNKVMRLLQNREFPVERGEIVAIASSAYDLRENECAQVVDLAVDRGLLVEREGQLYRPDDG